MPFVKSLSVGNGDMYYITHSSDNFTIIDCYITEDNKQETLREIKSEAAEKGITRFVSTHPDEDHIAGLEDLDDKIRIINFYCVDNKATKDDPSPSFKYYCALRDSAKAFNIYQGCRRKWMNQNDDQRGGAGLYVLWPNIANLSYKQALTDAADGIKFNNMLAIIQYRAANNVKMLWLGDLETEFMNDIEEDIKLEKHHIIFAPHHGRNSGKIPDSWLDKLKPDIIVIGEAPSRYLHYYGEYQKLTQNRAGHITFDMADKNKVHIYSSEKNYMPSTCVLDDENQSKFTGNYYIGTLNT